METDVLWLLATSTTRVINSQGGGTIPSTAQGKLNAVITPTIPKGFHTCAH